MNPGEVAARTLLPSFLYAPGELDFPPGSLALPWDESRASSTGELARRRGAENPARLVASAKSWLSHGGANRTSPILPWGAPDEVPHISPVDASAEYLKHLAAAFDSEVAEWRRRSRAGAPGRAADRAGVVRRRGARADAASGAAAPGSST